MEISEKMLGVTAVKENGNVIGVVTDGDIRRMLSNYDSINTITARDIMTKNPKTISPNVLAVKALETLREYGISQLLVMDGDRYMGIVHLHNLINDGIS